MAASTIPLPADAISLEEAARVTGVSRYRWMVAGLSGEVVIQRVQERMLISRAAAQAYARRLQDASRRGAPAA